MQDLYATLGVGRDSSNAAIKAAYRELAKQSHPDLHLGDGAAEDRTKEINYAYTILGDPESRAAYDEELDLAAARARRTAFVNNTAIAAGIAFFALVAGAMTFTVSRMHSSHTHFASEPLRPAAASRIATVGVPETAAAHSGISVAEAARAGGASGERREVTVQETEHAAAVSAEQTQTGAGPAMAAAPQTAPAGTLELAKAEPEQHAMPSALTEAQQQAAALAAAMAKAESEERAALPAAVAVQEEAAAGAIETGKAASEPKQRTVNRERAAARKVGRRSAERTRTIEAASFVPPRLQQESEPGWISSRKTMALRWPSADGPWGEMDDRTR
jgi:hypothetical protein